MIWVDIFKLGSDVHHGGRVITLGEEFANSMLRNFNRLTKEGAEIVVLKEHDRDGYVYGLVHALRAYEGVMQAQMSFLHRNDQVAFNAGMLRRFSPGFSMNYEHPHTGETMGPTLLEVSFTAMPHQINLRPPQETNPGVRLALSYNGAIVHPTDEVAMAAEEDEAAMPAEDAEAVTAPDDAPEEEEELAEDEAPVTRAEFDELSARIAALEPQEEPAEEEMAAELSAEEAQIVALSAENARLRDEAARTIVTAAGITEHVDALVALSRADNTTFMGIVELNRKAPAAPQTPIGVTGTAAVGNMSTVAEIVSLAADAGLEYGQGGGFTKWVIANYPEQLTDVLAVVRAD